MPTKKIIVTMLLLLLVAGCNRKHATNTTGEARLTPINDPENPATPFLLEGDYTPDTGVTYEVVVERDTCFVIVDSISEEQMHGHYYPVMEGSNCVEIKPFSLGTHWKEKRMDAQTFLYQPPAYNAIDDPRYRRESYKVNVKREIEYGQALGYWCSMKINNNEKYGEVLAEGLKNSLKQNTLSLTLDIYSPDNDDTLRPLILLFHGGAFYIGDKQDSAIVNLCQHFASMGYVAASANYRLGFYPTKNDIARSGYKALQDAHAAMRFLVDNAKEYKIDTSLIFVGGSSAGAITTLNLAYMTEKERPRASYGSSKKRNLGTIESSGNSSKAKFRIKAIANMWGAVTTLNMLKNSQTDIISFHGDADQIVPYDNNYPFNDISQFIGKRLFDRMYGSFAIDQRARELGLRSELYTFNGMGHSPFSNSDGSVNRKNLNIIMNKMTSFFFDEIIPTKAAIEEDRNDPRHYCLNMETLRDITWSVEGGYIMRMRGGDIWVVWRNDAKAHTLKASGHYANGIGFIARKNIENETQGETEE